MNDREKLIEKLHASLHVGQAFNLCHECQRVADRILAAGTWMPHEPKADPVEELAKEIEGIWLTGSHGYMSIARHVRRLLCAAKVEGIRERCSNCGPETCKCVSITCTRGWEHPVCGELQRAAYAEYGQPVPE